MAISQGFYTRWWVAWHPEGGAALTSAPLP